MELKFFSAGVGWGYFGTRGMQKKLLKILLSYLYLTFTVMKNRVVSIEN